MARDHGWQCLATLSYVWLRLAMFVITSHHLEEGKPSAPEVAIVLVSVCVPASVFLAQVWHTCGTRLAAYAYLQVPATAHNSSARSRVTSASAGKGFMCHVCLATYHSQDRAGDHVSRMFGYVSLTRSSRGGIHDRIVRLRSRSLQSKGSS